MWTLLMTISPQVAVVGGGPAGLAAGIEAARAGATVHLYDERPVLGGPTYAHAAQSTLIPEIHAAGTRIVLHQGATVWGVFEQRTLAVWEKDRAEKVRPEVLILAAGTQRRVVPVPGWTLPGVVDAETIRTLAPGQRVLVAGAGHQLPVVASRILRAGARVVGILDAAPAGRMPRALPAPWSRWALSGDVSADWHTLRAARVPLTGSRAVARVIGDEKVREVVTVALDGDWCPVRGSEETVAVGAVCLVWDPVPSIQLSQLCGVEHECVADRGGWIAAVSADMETSVRGIFCAGDGAGLGGAAVAVLEGRIAGIAAASRLGVLSPGEARSRRRPHLSELARLRKSRDVLGRLHAIKPGLAELITPDTVVCPCEGVTGARVDQALDGGVGELGQMKRMTRAGMGECQGRLCASALAQLIARRRGVALWAIAPPSFRPPVTPVPIDVLVTLADE
jgi:thioredoxin reductase/bacterioferritin-associated ferredoxin